MWDDLLNKQDFLNNTNMLVELKQRTDLMLSGIPQVRIPEYRFEIVEVQKLNGLFNIDNNTSTVKDYYTRVIDTTIGRLSIAGSIEVDKNINFWRAVLAGAEIGVLKDGQIKYYILHADDEYTNIDGTSITDPFTEETISYSSHHILSNGYADIDPDNYSFIINENPYWIVDTTRNIEIYYPGYLPLKGKEYIGVLDGDRIYVSAPNISEIMTTYVYWAEKGSAWYPSRLQKGKLFAPSGLPVFDMRITFNMNTNKELKILLNGVQFLSAKDNIDKGIPSMSIDFVAQRAYYRC